MRYQQHRVFNKYENGISELVQFLTEHREYEWYSQTVYLMALAIPKSGIAARYTVC